MTFQIGDRVLLINVKSKSGKAKYSYIGVGTRGTISNIFGTDVQVKIEPKDLRQIGTRIPLCSTIKIAYTVSKDDVIKLSKDRL